MIYTFLNLMTKLKYVNKYNDHSCILLYDVHQSSIADHMMVVRFCIPAVAVYFLVSALTF
jgi:hypothetical protein